MHLVEQIENRGMNASTTELITLRNDAKTLLAKLHTTEGGKVAQFQLSVRKLSVGRGQGGSSRGLNQSQQHSGKALAHLSTQSPYVDHSGLPALA